MNFTCCHLPIKEGEGDLLKTTADQNSEHRRSCSACPNGHISRTTPTPKAQQRCLKDCNSQKNKKFVERLFPRNVGEVKPAYTGPEQE